VAITRELAAANPAFRNDLASSLTNLGILLQRAGPPRRGPAPHRRGRGDHRELAAANPAFRNDLAMSCGALGQVMRGLGRAGEAAASFAEGINVVLPLAKAIPEAYTPLLRALFSDYQSSQEAAGLRPDDTLIEAVRAVLDEPQQSQ
jgi:hypothetical protein